MHLYHSHLIMRGSCNGIITIINIFLIALLQFNIKSQVMDMNPFRVETVPKKID